MFFRVAKNYTCICDIWYLVTKYTHNLKGQTLQILTFFSSIELILMIPTNMSKKTENFVQVRLYSPSGSLSKFVYICRKKHAGTKNTREARLRNRFLTMKLFSNQWVIFVKFEEYPVRKPGRIVYTVKRLDVPKIS